MGLKHAKPSPPPWRLSCWRSIITISSLNPKTGIDREICRIDLSETPLHDLGGQWANARLIKYAPGLFDLVSALADEFPDYPAGRRAAELLARIKYEPDLEDGGWYR